jgi:hypothetical protein
MASIDGSIALDRRFVAPGDARPRPRAYAAASPIAGFVLFLLVNAVLFIRPAEIFPSLQELPIYEVLMVGCLVVSLPVLLRQLTPTALRALPQIACVIGILFAILLSQLVRGQIFYAREGATEFLKVLLFYLLLLGLVNTPGRLRVFLLVTSGYIFAIAALALLQHHGLIHLEALEAMAMPDGYNLELGERITTIRLQASGIFHDPNDFALILVVGILVVTHVMLGAKGFFTRLACVAVLAVDFYALALTRSRGGLLAILAGMGVFLVSRLGWRKAAALGAVGLPVLLVAFGGRQTNFNFEDGDTGHGRVAIWRDAIGMFRASPLLGAGVGQMARQLHIVAHNSFVHAFTELGLLGGPLFLGVFYIPIRMIRQVRVEPGGERAVGTAGERRPSAEAAAPARTDRPRHRQPLQAHAQPAQLAAWRSCLLGVLTAYAVGLCSLSRPYTVTTYLILGVCGAFASLALSRGLIKAPPSYGFLSRKLAAMSVAFLVCVYLFVRLVV